MSKPGDSPELLNLALAVDETRGLRRGDRILITGGTGLVGHALEQELRDDGYEDVVVVGCERADLTDWDQALDLLKVLEPQVVFHLAARVYGIMGNVENPSSAYIDNIRINTNVVEAARQLGVRKVVAMGSTAIYSDDVSLPMREVDVWKGPPHGSEGPYAHAKRAMLAQLETYREHDGLEFVYCVATNLYGPNDRFDERWGHVIPSLISKVHAAMASGTPLTVWGTGAPTRDFLYSADAARAMRLLAERGSGVVNLASGRSHEIKTMVETLAEVAEFRGEILWDHTKPDGQKERKYDIERLAAIGFEPRWSLEAGLRHTFEWFDRHEGSARR